MKLTIIAFSLLLSTASFAVNYRELPANFDELGMFCSTWDAFDSDEMEQSLEKFSISAADESGVRTVDFNNSKESFLCQKRENGLSCSGYAYQVNDDQLLEETGEDQKFELTVKLDYSKHRSNLIEGVGVVPSGMFGRNKKRKLYCEFTGEAVYN